MVQECCWSVSVVIRKFSISRRFCCWVWKLKKRVGDLREDDKEEEEEEEEAGEELIEGNL